MAITHIGQTFSADPFVRITEFDTVSLEATIMELDPLIVSRPSVLKFTRDQNGLVVVTDRIASGTKQMQADDMSGNERLRMSKDGDIVTEYSAGVGTHIWRLVAGQYRKIATLFPADAPTAWFPVGMTDDGVTLVFVNTTTNEARIYKRFGNTLVLDHTLTGCTTNMKIIGNDTLLFKRVSDGFIISVGLLAAYAQITVYNSTAITINLPSLAVTRTGLKAAGIFRSASNQGVPVLFYRANTTSHAFSITVGAAVASDTSVWLNGSFNYTEDIFIFVHAIPGVSFLRTAQMAVGASSIVFLENWENGTVFSGSLSGFVSAPPVLSHGSGDLNVYNSMVIVLNGNAAHSGIRRLIWNQGAGRYNNPYPQPSGGQIAPPAGGWTITSVHWLDDLHPVVMNASASAQPGLIMYEIPAVAGPPTLDTADFPILDLDGFLPADVRAFTMDRTSSYVFYSRLKDGVATLFGGGRETTSPLGTYVSYYEKDGDAYVGVGVAAHPPGFKVKNLMFRGDDGNAVSYFLTDGPNNALEGRYVYDGNSGSGRILEGTGEVLDPAITNTYLEFGWDDYFVSNFDYSDTRDSVLKLYKFGSLSMDFTEKFSLVTAFGPLTLTNCWDIIVANGPLNNPFTMYKRVDDTIVQQPPLSIEWFSEYGAISDLVSLADCSGFIVVTEPGKVIVIETPPTGPEIVDIIDLYPPIDPELVDPSEPLPPIVLPPVPPEIELDPEGTIVITYPPDPLQPMPPIPGYVPPYPDPSPPIYPPIYPEIPPMPEVPPSPPEYPEPPIIEVKPVDGGGELVVLKRTARVSVNVAYER